MRLIGLAALLVLAGWAGAAEAGSGPHASQAQATVTAQAACGDGLVASDGGCVSVTSLSAKALFEKGYVALQSNDLMSAEALFREGLRRGGIEPHFQGLASYYLAEALRQQDKSKAEAIKYYQEAAKLLSGSKEADDSAAKAQALQAELAEPAKQPEDRPTTLAFLWNGSWNGNVTAIKWGGINTTEAWAVGKASEHDLRQMCQDPDQRASCVSELRGREPTEIFANCEEGVAWQKAFPDRYRLDELLAGTRPETHRSQTVVSSWFEMLCPKAWNQ